ncbi:MAG: hypothetical protein Q9210_006571, partial [Variospora velana]
ELCSLKDGLFPIPPPDYRTNIVHDSTKKLNPVSVYVVTITFIYSYPQSRWNSAASQTPPFMRLGRDVAIYIQSIRGPEVLTDGILLFCLWDGITAMSEWNRCESTVVEIFNHGHLAGKGWIVPNHESLILSGNATVAGHDDKALRALMLRDVVGHIAGRDDGRYINPRRPQLSVPYTFEGRRLIAKKFSPPSSKTS